VDESCLLEAEPTLRVAIAERVDFLVINESLGRGMVGTIASVIKTGVPILTAVRPPYAIWLGARSTEAGAASRSPDLEGVLSWASRPGAACPAHAPV